MRKTRNIVVFVVVFCKKRQADYRTFNCLSVLSDWLKNVAGGCDLIIDLQKKYIKRIALIFCAFLRFAGINLSVVAALAVIIGVCVVGMGYMAWQKKKEKSARKYIPLYEDLQN